jgi:signal transduction histidine kinase
LVEEILDLSKIEAGTFVINNMDFRLSELTQEVQELFFYQCQQKRIQFILSIDEQLKNEEVFSDKGRLKQILLNLISNSLKFTFEGAITLEIFKEIKNSEEILTFKVIDTGIGIKEKYRPKLFKLFGMISEARNVNPNGTGIGLTICKKY